MSFKLLIGVCFIAQNAPTTAFQHEQMAEIWGEVAGAFSRMPMKKSSTWLETLFGYPNVEETIKRKRSQRYITQINYSKPILVLWHFANLVFSSQCYAK